MSATGAGSTCRPDEHGLHGRYERPRDLILIDEFGLGYGSPDGGDPHWASTYHQPPRRTGRGERTANPLGREKPSTGITWLAARKARIWPLLDRSGRGAGRTRSLWRRFLRGETGMRAAMVRRRASSKGVGRATDASYASCIARLAPGTGIAGGAPLDPSFRRV
jgi:hypothetical protein